MRLSTALRLAPLAVALAAATPARAQAKLGYFDVDRAMEEIGEARAARAALEKDEAQKKAQLSAEETAINKMQEDLQKQAMLLTEEQKAQGVQKIQARVAEAQKLMLKLRMELADAEKKAMTPILERVNDFLREVAQANGLAVILDKRGVVYAEPSLDVTNEVIRKYDAKYPAPNAPKATRSAANPPKAQPKPAAKK